MNIGPNPLAADAARKALVENDRLDANHNEASSSRAALDAQELHDLERSLYYGAGGVAATPSVDPRTAEPQAQPNHRGLIARLFRRG